MAAVAGGIGPLALATDAGGSIRRPSGLAGVVGLKPGLGRIARRHGFPPLAHDFQVIGPVARCVADLRAIFVAVASEAARPVTAGRLRIATFQEFPDAKTAGPLDPAVAAAFSSALDVLRSLGHQVDTVAPFWDPDEAGAIFAGLTAVGVARIVGGIPDWRKRATPVIAALAEAGQAAGGADYVLLLDRLAAFRWRVQDRFRCWDVLATPVSPTVGWARDQTGPATIGGAPAHPRAAAAFSTAVNAAGLAALSIPAPVQDGAMPVGLHLVGPAGSEEMLLDLAAAYEAIAPWPQLAPLPRPISRNS